MKFQVRVVLELTCLDRWGSDVACPEPGSEDHVKLTRALTDAIWNSLNGTSDERHGFIYDKGRKVRIAVDGVDSALPIAAKRPTVEEVLREFVDDVNRAGGLVLDPAARGLTAPAASPDWTDLAVTYEDACDALGLAPEYAEGDNDNDDEI